MMDTLADTDTDPQRSEAACGGLWPASTHVSSHDSTQDLIRREETLPVSHIQTHNGQDSMHASSQTNTWLVLVTAPHTEPAQPTKLSDSNVVLHNNAIKSYNNCLQEVSEAIMLSEV